MLPVVINHPQEFSQQFINYPTNVKVEDAYQSVHLVIEIVILRHLAATNMSS